MLSRSFAAAAAGAAFIVSAAHATVVPYALHQVGPSGSLEDPRPPNYDVYDLQVSISPGDHWAGCSMTAQLSGGSIFYIPDIFDSDTGLQLIAQFVPALLYDTFISRPGFADPGSSAILGGSTTSSATFPRQDNAKDLVDVTWGDVNATQNNLVGVQSIARLTIRKQGTTGAPGLYLITGKVTGTADPSVSNFFTFTNTPEPDSAAILLAISGGVVMVRRSRVK